jgi:5-methylthioribose kinase
MMASDDHHWLKADDPADVEKFLRRRGWIGDETVQTIARAGEGNMNLTLRVVTDVRSTIIKQARPWVEKYQHIPAPVDRMDYEIRFYERVDSIAALARRMPRLLNADRSACAVQLEDLAPAQDLTPTYAGAALTDLDLAALADYLAVLHSVTHGEDLSPFANRSMRALNHAHIFVIPFAPIDGFDIERFEPGLGTAARAIHEDADLRRAVTKLGETYLADGPSLVHGDFFPGSWLQRQAGDIAMIDGEFCHAGRGEFDVGVALAHLRMMPAMNAEQAALLLARYRQKWALDEELVAGYAGVEILRRTLGVAQLPIAPTGGERRAWIASARQAVMSRRWEDLWSAN